MVRHTVRPNDSLGNYEVINKAFANNNRLTTNFISNEVTVYDNTNNQAVDSLAKDKDDTSVLPIDCSKCYNEIDYYDILDNLDDYEYPYNHINKGEL